VIEIEFPKDGPMMVSDRDAERLLLRLLETRASLEHAIASRNAAQDERNAEAKLNDAACALLEIPIDAFHESGATDVPDLVKRARDWMIARQKLRELPF
jgi:hypothetical protein